MRIGALSAILGLNARTTQATGGAHSYTNLATPLSRSY